MGSLNRALEITAELDRAVEEATSMHVGLPDDDSPYDLNFISDKLKKISVYQERLSDIQLRITKISLEVTQQRRAHESILSLKTKEFKAQDEYRELHVEYRGHWLANQLSDFTEEAERWINLSEIVSTVKEAVGERVSTMRRLDSDIRLHTKIYEAKVAAGATHPASYTGASTTDVDID